MDKRTLYDPCLMFEHGCAFADCARLCETEPNNIKYRMHSHTVAGIVNSAFACEIFLKALLLSHGCPKAILRGEKDKGKDKRKGHDLSYLWEKFQEVDIETTLNIEQRMKLWFNSKNENMFDEMLLDMSNAFEHWRYIYEKDSAKINLNFLIGLRNILQDTCCREVHGKSWTEYIENSME